MLKRFGTTTVVLFVVGFGSASSSHVNAQAPETDRGRDGTTDLRRLFSGIEEESYRAWQSNDTKFWYTFLSEKFVSWGLSGRMDKAAAIREWSGTNCKIASYQISDSQVNRLTPEAAVITHKTTVDAPVAGTGSRTRAGQRQPTFSKGRGGTRYSAPDRPSLPPRSCPSELWT